jgi:uncharacterized membrane protein
MQTISWRKVCNFLAAAIALIATFSFTAPVFADTEAILNSDGKLTHLGTVGGANSVAAAINDAGQVVGGSYTDSGSRVLSSGGRDPRSPRLWHASCFSPFDD